MNLNRAGLRQMVLGFAGRLLKWSVVNRLSSRKGWVYADLPPSEPSLGEESQTQLVRLIQQFGFRSQPVAGSEIIVGAPRACGTNAVALGTDNLSRGPSDLAEGECAIYSSADKMNGGVQELCRIRLSTDGTIFVLPKSGAKVKLGDTADANLDSLCTFARMKAYVDAHTHAAGTLAAGMTPVTGVTGAPVSALPANVATSNTVAKKT